MAKSGSLPRICFLISAFPPMPGGLEQHAYCLAEKLISSNLELFVLTRRTDPTLNKYERLGNVPVVRFLPCGSLQGRGWKALYLLPLTLIKVLYLLIKYSSQYDIIMVSELKLFIIPAIIVKLFTGKKCTIKLESQAELWKDVHPETLRLMNLSLPLKLLRSLFLKLFSKLAKLIIKEVDSFVAISSEIKQGLINLGVESEKICYIPNAIVSDKFSPVSHNEKLKIRQKLSLPTEKFIFVFSGRLAITKGVLLLIQVWQEIMIGHTNLHLIYVGTGKNSLDNCEIELREFIKRNGIDNVTLTGEVKNVYEYLQASDVFIFPSYYEGFSLALIEALSCALPTIATKVGAAADVIQDYETGILINPNDKQELKTAIEWFLNNRNSGITLGNKSLVSVGNKYSLEVISNKYLQMFQKLQEDTL